MKQIRISVILTILSILTSNSIYGSAPGKRDHEFSIYGSGGMSALRYKISNVDIQNGAGGNFGVGYTFFFNHQLGVHIGTDLGMYRTKVKANDYNIVSSDLIDIEGDRFDMHTRLFDYTETQKALFLNVPVMAVYRQRMIYFMGGVKTGIPINGKYTSSCAKLENLSYYPEFDNWATTQKFAGIGKFDDKNFNGNFKLGMNLMLALEAGTKIDVRGNIALYVGAFFDCGLNNVLKEKNQSFIKYTAKNPSNFNAKMVSVSDKSNMVAVGIIVRMHFKNSAKPEQYRRDKNMDTNPNFPYLLWQ